MTMFWTIATLLSLGVGALGKDVYAAEQCLSSITNLLVLTSSNPDFETQKQPFNLRIDPSPTIIVFPLFETHVQSIITCAAETGLSVSARSGGHSYAAYGLEGDIVIDLRNMTGITVHSDGTAIVQTGNRLGEVATEIFKQGGRALAHGSCPYVGTGGHTLYGGFGYFSRIRGLLLDQVVSADVVLADGTLVKATNTTNTDLFWAIRGGGPSFGLVTSWTFETVPAPPTTVNYLIQVGQAPVSQLVSAYLAWQSFATTGPDPLVLAAVFGTPQGSLALNFSGNYYGSQSDFFTAISPLMEMLPGANLSSRALGWIEGLEALAGNNGSLDTSKPDVPDTFFAKSLVTTKPSSDDSISAWINYMATNGPTSNTSWFAQVDQYGGVISKIPNNATAFAQRDAFLVYQLYASSSDHMRPYPDNGVKFVDDMLHALEPNPEGAYSNYIDPTLSTEEWKRLYFGSNVQRLETFKSVIDPTNIFKYTQGF